MRFSKENFDSKAKYWYRVGLLCGSLVHWFCTNHTLEKLLLVKKVQQLRQLLYAGGRAKSHSHRGLSRGPRSYL